jgi:hypothetical protein
MLGEGSGRNWQSPTGRGSKRKSLFLGPVPPAMFEHMPLILKGRSSAALPQLTARLERLLGMRSASTAICDVRRSTFTKNSCTLR